MKFDIKAKFDNSLIRSGVIHTSHGDIKTPAFIGAATKGTVKALTFDQLEDLGAQSILVNTYHLLLQPGPELLKQVEGIHKLSGYSKPIFSDSGGFQIMSLLDVKITDEGVTFKSHIDGQKFIMTPENSILTQHIIGSDIHFAFDCPIGYGKTDNSRDNAKKTLEITHSWAKRCLKEHQKLNNKLKPQSLFGVVQGGQFEDLREKSANFFSEMNFDGFGIGGMYSSDELGQKILKIMTNILPEQKPRHWLGMGSEPRDLFVGIENGIDTFDCVAPTRQARNGALYTKAGRINISNARFSNDLKLVDKDCNCYTCRNHSRAYIHHLFKAGEINACILASIHNEYFVVNLVDRIRETILNGSLKDFNDLKSNFLSEYYK